MNTEVEKIGFGAIDESSEDLKAKSNYSKFGLNEGFLTKIEYNPNSGKGNSPGDAIDITVIIGEKEYRNRIFDITRVYNKGNILNPGDTEYNKMYNKEMAQIMAVITHVIKSVGVTDDKIKRALAVPPDNFKEWAIIMTDIVPTNYSEVPLDIFLEYQWNISEGQNKTYLTLPKNMKGGYFIVKSEDSEGKWVESTEWHSAGKKYNGLRYVSDSGKLHSFTRDMKYMESNKAVRQFNSPAPENVQVDSEDSSKSTWT